MSETKTILYRGQFVEVPADAVSVPKNVQGQDPSDFVQSQPNTAPAETVKDSDNGDELEDLLNKYQADEENTSSPFTKPWYKHELQIHKVDFAPNANAETLKQLFEEGLQNNWEITSDDQD